MKTKERKQESVEQMAADYRAIMLQIKDLEKQAAPAKKFLIDYAKTADVPTLVVGDVNIDRRITAKGSIDQDQITTEWLDKMATSGYNDLVKVDIDYKGIQAKLPDNNLEDLLTEVGFEEKETVTYAIRV